MILQRLAGNVQGTRHVGVLTDERHPPRTDRAPFLVNVIRERGEKREVRRKAHKRKGARFKGNDSRLSRKILSMLAGSAVRQLFS